MFSKAFRVFSISLLTVLFLVSASFAEIRSDYDVERAIQSLEQIGNTEFSTFYNKTDMIGERAEHFKKFETKYKRQSKEYISKLKVILAEKNQKSDNQNSVDEDRYYLLAEDTVNDFQNCTDDFLDNVSIYMPSLTYKKFFNKFNDFYQSLNLSE